jgi:hypothetical protein
MSTRDDLEHALSMVPVDARDGIIDSLHCVFHNEGYGMEGNTEESDVAWLANRISLHLFESDIRFLSEARQREMMEVAHAARSSLADLTERMSRRYIRASKAIRTFERLGESEQRKKRQSQ